MHKADDALDARLRLEEQAIQAAFANYTVSSRFTKPTAMFVLIDEYGDYLLECDSLIDRNAALRERGVDLSRDRWASAYYNGEKFVISGNDQEMAVKMMEKLGLA